MSHEQGAHKSWVSRICYAIGNLGQAAYYNALSTFFVTYYAAQTLFRDYEAEEATGDDRYHHGSRLHHPHR